VFGVGFGGIGKARGLQPNRFLSHTDNNRALDGELPLFDSTVVYKVRADESCSPDSDTCQTWSKACYSVLESYRGDTKIAWPIARILKIAKRY
jgi:hypothetical protein